MTYASQVGWPAFIDKVLLACFWILLLVYFVWKHAPALAHFRCLHLSEAIVGFGFRSLMLWDLTLGILVSCLLRRCLSAKSSQVRVGHGVLHVGISHRRCLEVFKLLSLISSSAWAPWLICPVLASEMSLKRRAAWLLLRWLLPRSYCICLMVIFHSFFLDPLLLFDLILHQVWKPILHLDLNLPFLLLLDHHSLLVLQASSVLSDQPREDFGLQLLINFKWFFILKRIWTIHNCLLTEELKLVLLSWL